MRGFKVGAKPKAPRSIKSGTIQGPGTGTSDDVKATVAEGSYVMPADSTAQIGAEQLQGMGAPVDVNLSNGEQVMPPEQVHAVGVQALDALKNATHLPAAQQRGSKGFQPRGHEQGKPELFFADGGVVEEPRKKQTSFDITNTPAAQRAAGIITNAEAAQRAAGVAPATPVAPTPAPAAQLAPKVAPGYSSNPAIADAQATQDASNQAKAAGGDNPARAAQMQAQYNQPVTKSTVNAAGFAGSAGERLTSFGNGVVNTAVGAGKALLATPLDLAHQGIVAAVDGDTRSMPGGGLGFRTNAFQQLDKGMGQVASAFDGAKAGARSLLGVKEAAPRPGQPSLGLIASAEAAPVQPATPQAVPSSTVASADGPSEAPPTAAASAGTQGAATLNTNNVTRVGNSFSGTSIRPGYTVNGQPASQGGSAPRSAQNERAVQNLLANTPEMGSGPQVGRFPDGTPYPIGAPIIHGAKGFTPGGVTVVRDSGRDEAIQRRALAAASTPYRGSQNGQLTANQVNNLGRMQESVARNATDLAREQMQQDGANARTAISEAGANQRFAQSNALDQQRTAAEVESKGFAARPAQRIEKLYEKYEAAKPEDRQAIAEQISDLSGLSRQGESLSSNFMKVKRPVFDDKGTMLGEQEELVDLRQIGKGQQQAAQPSSPPPANHIEALKNNPTLAAQFDARYGQGASARYLGAN